MSPFFASPLAIMGCSSSKSASARAAEKQQITRAADTWVKASNANDPKIEEAEKAKAVEPKADANVDSPTAEKAETEADLSSPEVQVRTVGADENQTACTCSLW